MATKPKARPKSRTSHIPHVTKTRGAVKEANELYATAEAVKRRSSNLLSPADINGRYDAGRVCYEPAPDMSNAGGTRFIPRELARYRVTRVGHVFHDDPINPTSMTRLSHASNRYR